MLTTAELTSNVLKYSVGTYLRKGKDCSTATVRGLRQPCSDQGGGGGAPGAVAKIPLQTMEKIMMTQFVLLQPMEDATLEQVDVP